MDAGNSTGLSGITTTEKNSGFHGVFVLTVVLLFSPAILFNFLAVVIFGTHLSKSPHQATRMLFVLSCVDTAATLESVINHGFIVYGGSATRAYCGVVSFLESFLPLYGGFVATLIAIDRYLALCQPFFYKTSVDSFHGKLYLVVSAVFVSVLASLPFAGLGEYHVVVEGTNTTNSSAEVSQQIRCVMFKADSEDGTVNVFGTIYSVVGLCLVFLVVLANSFVTRAVLRMRMVIDKAPSNDTKKSLSAEVAFAKVMAGLSLVFLVSWTPYMISLLAMSCGQVVSYSTSSVLHTVAAFNFLADPFVYVFLRRRYRLAVWGLVRGLFRCCRSSQTGTSDTGTNQSDIPFL